MLEDAPLPREQGAQLPASAPAQLNSMGRTQPQMGTEGDQRRPQAAEVINRSRQ